MTAVSALPDDVLAALLDAADEHRACFSPRQQFNVVRLCAESVAFAREEHPVPAAIRARASARLMLDLAFPTVPDRHLEALARACEAICTEPPHVAPES